MNSLLLLTMLCSTAPLAPQTDDTASAVSITVKGRSKVSVVDSPLFYVGGGIAGLGVALNVVSTFAFLAKPTVDFGFASLFLMPIAAGASFLPIVGPLIEMGIGVPYAGWVLAAQCLGVGLIGLGYAFPSSPQKAGVRVTGVSAAPVAGGQTVTVAGVF